MRKRIAYSQNFLKNKGLISDLINKSSITNEDIVYEIGAGQGIITHELLKKAKKVIAFEIDKNLFNKLTQRFENERLVELKQGNFLTHSLPSCSYKVFSNIPFNITSEVIKKLTQANNPPEDAYLIIQKEAASKFIGKPIDIKNSQISILLKPLFELSIFYEFENNDFFPKPNVDTVLLRIKKRNKPLIQHKNIESYENLITYAFNQFKPNVTKGLSDLYGKETILKLSKELGFSPKSKPSELDIKDWLGLFSYFLYKIDSKHKSIIKGSYKKQLVQQKKLNKIHRTRINKDWKQYVKELSIKSHHYC